jgi:hypothetical protein
LIEWIVDARAATPLIADQGQRPTCLTMAMTGAHELALQQTLSAEYLHWASGQYPGGRGIPAAARAALRNDGQPPGPQWLYHDSTDEMAADYKPPDSVTGPFCRRRTDLDITDIDEMIEELRNGRWPVLGLRVTNAFAAAGDAIVLPDGTGRAGHAVLVVGAARVAGHALAPRLVDGERLLCLRNSWGSAWGRDGHKLMSESALREAFLVAFALNGS